MAHYDERLRGIEDRLGNDGPERTATPGRDAPRGGRPVSTWLWLAVGIVGLVSGIVIGHGLLIAAGLVVAGMAAQLLDPQRRTSRNSAPRLR
ncbi:DUF3040 domain-containing protein [Streptomyces sp. NPDC005794]|uniref:DUF3040 domain-containing protein n=1 Tax=Streptomyces sp. NPDC005794 TaxID=3364733 RepID=UPI0036CC8930